MGISLYDAQYEPGNGTRIPIPEKVQSQILSSLLRFKTTCEDFRVPTSNIKILATEATRSALNSTEFIATIRQATGWELLLLPKEEEGRIGALGTASSSASIDGLMMDLGGGSVQLTWIVFKNGTVDLRPGGSISLPYGAAALTRRLNEAQGRGSAAVRELQAEMSMNFQEAIQKLEIPETLVSKSSGRGGFDLYLSGGGFRGWGYLLMSQSKISPYPIPIINGFSAKRSDFYDTTAISRRVLDSGSSVYGVSDRRASQVPAVAFLINTLADSLPSVKNIHFCQGGVREGFLFDKLPQEIRLQHPLVVATSPYRPRSMDKLSSLLLRSFPLELPPPPITKEFLIAVTNSMYVHSIISKECRGAAALHSTTTGMLASVHGLSHTDRAMLALVLYDRWRGDLSPPDLKLLHLLRLVVSLKEAWWCQYIGRVAALVGHIYPAGVIGAHQRLDFSAHWGKHKNPTKTVVELEVKIPNENDPSFDSDSVITYATKIQKVGKKGHYLRASERSEYIGFQEEKWKPKVAVDIDISTNET